MNRARPIILALVLASLSACKGTEDYLSDLQISQEKRGARNVVGRTNLEVYDATALIHEGLTGLMTEEVLTLSQLGRAVHEAGRILEGNEVPLLRADAISLLAHVTLRYPLAPLSRPFESESGIDSLALQALEKIDAAFVPLGVPGHIDGLANPDRVVAEENWVRLKSLSGLDLPRDQAAWQAWWDRNRDRVLREAQDAAVQPLHEVAYLRYRSLASTRAMLGYLATWLQRTEFPDLQDEFEEAVTRIARQTVTFGVQRGLADGDPVVRSAAARAARDILDPAFEPHLILAYAREVDPSARVQLLKSLAWYPSGSSLELLVQSVGDLDRSVSVTARELLASFAGEDLGEDPIRWGTWWEQEGKNRWP